jgi:hypothetical protein
MDGSGDNTQGKRSSTNQISGFGGPPSSIQGRSPGQFSDIGAKGGFIYNRNSITGRRNLEAMVEQLQ